MLSLIAMSWIPLLALTSLPEGALREVHAAGRAFAVCRVEGEAHVLDNVCPHVGGPLGQGNLVGHLVICPFHAWGFDCRTGSMPGSAGIEVKRYPSRVVEGMIEIEVDEDS